MYNWNTFGAQTNHGHTQIHMTHHNPNLVEATIFPLIIFFVISHGRYIEMLYCPRILKLEVPKLLKLRFL